MVQRVKERGKNVFFGINYDFFLLVDIQAAPIWDSRKRRFVGLMTVTDYIDILRQCTHRLVVPFSAMNINHIILDCDYQCSLLILTLLLPFKHVLFY